MQMLLFRGTRADIVCMDANRASSNTASVTTIDVVDTDYSTKIDQQGQAGKASEEG